MARGDEYGGVGDVMWCSGGSQHDRRCRRLSGEVFVAIRLGVDMGCLCVFNRICGNGICILVMNLYSSHSSTKKVQ